MRLAKGSFLTLSSEMLGQGHNLYCRTIGSSMFSLIRSRSLIQVQPVEMEHLRPGDVILYRSGEVLVAHRFLREEQERGRKRLITRGDAFPWSATEPLTPEQVLGRVMAVEWPLGLKLRIDQDPGRLLSFLLAKIATLLLPVYLA